MRKVHTLAIVISSFLSCPLPSSAQVLPGQLRISELVATNQDGLRDEDGDLEDWVEIENLTATPIPLDNFYLTDSMTHLLKWKFPPISLPANGFFVVFASGKDRRPLSGELHCNFKLDRRGEFLAIADAASQVVDEVSPAFPPQYPGFSYGRDPLSGVFRFLLPPSPGRANDRSEVLLGALESLYFSPDSGFFDGPLELNLYHPDPLAAIHYTVDGSTPTLSAARYETPIQVVATAVIRARAFREGYLPSQIDTRTYLIEEDESIRSLPAISVATSPDSLFGATEGIFANPSGRGRAWERPGNIEWIHPTGEPGFSAPCGIRFHGSEVRRDPGLTLRGKNSLRIYFREVYGLSEETYPIIPLSDVAAYRRLVLRAGSNDDRNPFVRDEYVRRTYRSTGQASCLGTFAFLFLNGTLQGYYNPVERLDDDFMRSHYGGTNEWDVIRQGSVAADGDNTAWLGLLDFVRNHDLSIPANYEIVDSSLDLVNFVDYLLVNIYASVGDWPTNNWTAARERAPGAKFRFYIWDAEASLQYLSDNTFTVRLQDTSEVSTLYEALRVNPLFQTLWAQRVRDQFYGDGAMTDANLRERWFEIRDEVSGVAALGRLASAMPNEWVKRRTMIVLSHLFDEGFNLVQPINDLEPNSCPTVAINEFMARNATTIADGSDEYDDWIEIHNLTAGPLDLSGMFLSDGLARTTAWEFPPGTVMEPSGFLLVWADGQPTQGPLHTNFRLDANGEEIGLFGSLAGGNTLLDSAVFGHQEVDVSIGRKPDGIGAFGETSEPSPGEPNGVQVAVSGPEDNWAILKLDVGKGVASVAIGDVNRDGSPDLVSSNYSFGRVAVFLGKGLGSRSFRGPFFYPAAIGAKGITLADLNGDTYPDVITAHDRLVDHAVTTLLNDGNGAFVSPVSFPLYALGPETRLFHPHWVDKGDFNGDGWLDVVVSNTAPSRTDNRLSVLLNDGTGSLLPPSQQQMTNSLNLAVGRNLATVDLDGDLDSDLVSLTDSGALSVALNLGGTLGAATNTPSALNPSQSLAVADVDRDADPDLASISRTGQCYIYRNTGNGSFSEPFSFSVPGLRRLETLTSEDFDGDGDRDLVFAMSAAQTGDGPGFEIFVNDGNGNFEPGGEGYEAPDSSNILTVPEAIESADLDGDGAPDLVVVDNTLGSLVVFYNQVQRPRSGVKAWGRYE